MEVGEDSYSLVEEGRQNHAALQILIKNCIKFDSDDVNINIPPLPRDLSKEASNVSGSDELKVRLFCNDSGVLNPRGCSWRRSCACSQLFYTHP
ncbi:hypothetical protein SDJN02_12916, partial [Cucurbita argyrosperma subsp. argyrosperma]